MRNTTDVTGGKPIAVLLQPISGVIAINPLIAFYDIHGGKTEVLFFYFVPDTTRDCILLCALLLLLIFHPGLLRRVVARNT
jgi:Na+-transporting NADH:ubiquinone oxidoreductase subunit NqrB